MSLSPTHGVAILAWLILGILVARVLAHRRVARLVDGRLDDIIAELSLSSHAVAAPILKEAGEEGIHSRNWFDTLGFQFKETLDKAMLAEHSILFVSWLILSLLGPLLATVFFQANILASGMVCALSVSSLFIIVAMRKAATRRKFTEQLPDAIDLLVSILRVGHGISSAVAAVAQEIPKPCGHEFNLAKSRVSLGVTLADSLMETALNYDSEDLLLIAKAINLHTEVGGSLVELLEKTNQTLRQRLKLARQVRVLTSQSRLTALILACVPIFLATALQFMHPGYLDPLTESELGAKLVVAAFALWMLGVFILHRLTTGKA